VVFVVGAVFGLTGGLVFGGSKGTASAKTPGVTKAATSITVKGGSAATSTTQGAAAAPVTAERARAIGANEMGQIMVIEYHIIGPGEAESQYTRTPENFAKDLALLQAEGYYPINLRDMISGNIEVPAGKSPVVLTFDDSSIGQYRLLDNGTLDPACAVGMLQAAVQQGNWASRATFFPLLDVDAPDRVVFGQESQKKAKVQQLVKWGYEIGSHTISHLNLKKANTAEAVKQLAVSKATLEGLAGNGYVVQTLSVPFGEYPSDDSIIAGGTYEGKKYTYKGAVEVAGGPSASPFSTLFKPLHILRIQMTGSALKNAVDAYKENPELRFVSDGDPAAISAPNAIVAKLGALQENLGRPVVRY
jgi:peptidoglycan/xylan/chitin deacetylase (PgdA/CDA1 family)